MKLKPYIESMLDDVFIMSKYLKIDTNIIEECLTTSKKINNPLRYDKKPSASFTYKNGKLILTDYAKPFYSGDIYEIVGISLNLNCNDNKDFIVICNHIIDNLIRNKKVYKTYKKSNINPIKIVNSKNKSFTKIIVEYKNWSNQTFLYWYNYVKPNKELATILINVLQDFNIFPIERYWLNENIRASKTYKNSEPIYSYLLKTDKMGRHYKLYFPKSNIKFVTNGSDSFNYLNKIKNNDYLIIVKSIKDLVFLKSITIYLNITNVEFIPIASESINLDSNEIDNFKKRFNKIFIFYDWDFAGITNAFYNSILYSIEPIFITNILFNPMNIKMDDINVILNKINKHTNFKVTIKHFLSFIKLFKQKRYASKDFSDYLELYGVTKGIVLFETYYNIITTKVLKN